ncbi:6168_t:CDS:1, partial [Dentiscutata heterogama]
SQHSTKNFRPYVLELHAFDSNSSSAYSHDARNDVTITIRIYNKGIGINRHADNDFLTSN